MCELITNECKNGKHYVFGDLHGARYTLQSAIKDNKIDLTRDFVYFVGDYYYYLKWNPTDDDKELFKYLSDYYQEDMNKPGFHLVRGNHEWWDSHLLECFGNISISHLPDIVRVRIDKNYEFVIAHSGMSRELYEFMKKNKLFSAQIDINWPKNQNGRKYYNQIIWTKKEETPTYKDAEKIGDNIFVIHGHCPVRIFEGDNNCGYTVIKHENRSIAAVNGVNWIDIDAGIKEGNRSLSFICLEDFISSYESTQCIKQALQKSIVNTLYVEKFEETEKPKSTYANDRKLGEHGIAKIILNKKNELDIEKNEIEWKEIELQIQNNKYTKFIEAIKEVAEVKCENNSSEIANKEKISSAIVKIIEFVRANGSANIMVKDMFGFALNGQEKSKVDKEGEEEFEKRWKKFLNKMPLKQYLYFVADMKIKATVYLLRIHHFINRNKEEIDFETDIKDKIRYLEIKEIKKFFGEDTQSNVEDKEYKCIEEILEETQNEKGNAEQYRNDSEKNDGQEKKSKSKKYIECCIAYLQETNEEKKKEKALQAENLEKKILEGKEQNYKTNEEMNMPIFQNYLDRIDEIKNKEKSQLLDDTYYLFDNSMQEIEFCGIEWKWLWRYERGLSDLFRCVGTNKFTYWGTMKEKGRAYYQQMIKNVVEHMNKGDEKPKLASYSKNPYRDIYKYMNYKNFDVYIFNSTGDNVELSIEKGTNDENNNFVIFAMVKKAHTNIIKKAKKAESTQGDFKIIKKIENNSNASEYTDYIVTKDAEKNIKSFSEFVLSGGSGEKQEEYIYCVDILNNKARYRGDIRMVFQEYTDTFPEIYVPGTQRNIVSSLDEEVVMLGNTCSEIVEIANEKDSEKELCDNTEYRITLDQNEMIALFRGMWLENDKSTKEEIKMKEIEMISKKIKLTKDENSYSKNQEDDIYKINDRILVKIKKNNDDLQCENELTKKTIEEKEKEKENERVQSVKEKIAECIAGISCDTSWKIEFIMKFIREYQRDKNYGNSIYQSETGDALINLCKALYLK